VDTVKGKKITDRLKQKLDEIVKSKQEKDILGKLALLQPNKVGQLNSQNSEQQTENIMNSTEEKKLGIGLR
jgi:hypothetical protein